MSLARGGSILGLFLAAVGCGDEKTGGPSGTGMSTTMEITAATGGMVTLEGTTLMVPAGALPADTMITITSTTAAPPSMFKTWNSPLFKFEPDGLVFLSPVMVTLEFTGSPMSPSVHWSSAASGLENLGGSVTGNRITTSVTHFSEGFVADGAFDAGVVAIDAPMLDGGVPPGNDAANPPGDSGTPLGDAGADAPPDAMQPDGGTPQPDGGATPIDAGADAMQPDGGTPQPDGGTPQPDGGTPQPDGGAFPIDGGAQQPDGGTPPPLPDGGAPSDGGAILIDGGPDGGAPTDASPPDAGP